MYVYIDQYTSMFYEQDGVGASCNINLGANWNEHVSLNLPRKLVQVAPYWGKL